MFDVICAGARSDRERAWRRAAAARATVARGGGGGAYRHGGALAHLTLLAGEADHRPAARGGSSAHRWETHVRAEGWRA